MSGRAPQEADQSRNVKLAAGQSTVSVTVFSLPKPFTEPDVCRIQANAIRSWQALGERVEVLLLGKEAGIEAFAKENGVKHCGEIESNSRGTPLVSSAFAQANRLGTSEFLLYCNADVVLSGEIVDLADDLGEKWPRGFLGIGRRNEVSLEGELDWKNREQVQQELDEAFLRSSKAPRVCKEYFLFRRGQYLSLPGFAVGRGNWDNWLVSHSHQAGIPVVDLSQRIRALHQKHGYSHLGKAGANRSSRWSCYVAGDEARANEKLAVVNA